MNNEPNPTIPCDKTMRCGHAFCYMHWQLEEEKTLSSKRASIAAYQQQVTATCPANSQ